MPFADLNTAWFALIGLLWAGYFFLEGFDFGVGVMTPLLARDELDRRLCLNAVGPTWDGNEVWLLVAGGATFAAFPLWYARLFSGFYLALFLVLFALIARGVSFEFRDKDRRPGWKAVWDWANFLGSLVPAIVWGVAFTDLVHGLPLGPGGRYSGGLIGLLHPVALLGGVTSLVIFCLHGSLFLSLKTTRELSGRARAAAATTRPRGDRPRCRNLGLARRRRPPTRARRAAGGGPHRARAARRRCARRGVVVRRGRPLRTCLRRNRTGHPARHRRGL